MPEYKLKCGKCGANFIGASPRRKICLECEKENRTIQCVSCNKIFYFKGDIRYKPNFCLDCFNDLKGKGFNVLKCDKCNMYYRAYASNNNKCPHCNAPKNYWVITCKKCGDIEYKASNHTQILCNKCEEERRTTKCENCGKEFYFSGIFFKEYVLCDECKTMLLDKDDGLKLYKCKRCGEFYRGNVNTKCEICRERDRIKGVNPIQLYLKLVNKDSKIINNILLLDLKLDKDRPTKVCNICNREYNQKANNQIWCGKCYYIKKCKNCNHNMLANRDLKVCSRICNVKNNWKEGVYKNHLSLIRNSRKLNNLLFVMNIENALKIISEENIKNLPYRIISSFEEYLEIIKIEPEYGFVRLLNDGSSLIYSAQTNAKDYEKSIVKQIFNKARKAEYMKHNIDSMKIIWGFNSDEERLAVEGYYDSFAKISVQNKSI